MEANEPKPLVGDWFYPTEVRFGAGRFGELGDACAVSGMARPLLVTDRVLADLPITQVALEAMERAGLGRAVFCDVDANPSEKNLGDASHVYREGKHDGVIAFGGGSALDLGKTLALMARQTRPVWDFEKREDWWKRADPNAIDPIVAVPTTAGTGSEVSRGCVISNAQTAEKKIIFHPRLLPTVAICDPQLTVSMPAAITAGTGMDAMAHCLEAYCSPVYHPMSRAVALEGMRLIKESLPTAYRDGADLTARAHMMAAAAMGAVAFQAGLGAIHALSHPIGAMYHTHHGTTNATVMTQVLAFNRPAIEQEIAHAADYLAICGGFDGFVAYLEQLKKTLSVPSSLRELGVKDPDIDRLVDGILRDPCTATNPVEITRQGAARLLEACL